MSFLRPTYVAQRRSLSISLHVAAALTIVAPAPATPATKQGPRGPYPELLGKGLTPERLLCLAWRRVYPKPNALAQLAKDIQELPLEGPVPVELQPAGPDTAVRVAWTDQELRLTGAVKPGMPGRLNYRDFPTNDWENSEMPATNTTGA